MLPASLPRSPARSRHTDQRARRRAVRRKPTQSCHVQKTNRSMSLPSSFDRCIVIEGLKYDRATSVSAIDSAQHVQLEHKVINRTQHPGFLRYEREQFFRGLATQPSGYRHPDPSDPVLRLAHILLEQISARAEPRQSGADARLVRQVAFRVSTLPAPWTTIAAQR